MGLQHLTLLVLCVSGCADSARTLADSGRDAGSSRAGGIDLSGFVGWLGPAGDTRLEDVEICQDGVPNCAMTDVHGWFALSGIIPETEILLVYRKDGFMPSLQAVVAPRWSSELPAFALARRDDVLLASWERQNAVLHDAGRPEVDLSDEAVASRAQILFGASSGIPIGASSGRMGLDHVHVELDPRSGAGPFFGDMLDAPTGEASVFGSYRNVEPRDDGYELVYQYAHGECRQGSNAWGGWPSAKGRPNATRVPARAGYITAITAEECKSADAGTASDAGQD